MSPIIRERFKWVVSVFAVCPIILVFRIIMLMNSSEAIQMKEELEPLYQTMTLDVSSERGNIYDRYGYMLAGNSISYSVSLNLQKSNGHGEFIADKISPIFGFDPEEVKRIAEIPYVQGKNVEYLLTNYATKEQIERLEVVRNTLSERRLEGFESKTTKLENLDSVVYYPNIHRYYPDGNLAFNILGFYPYRSGTSSPAYGIEQYYDDILSSKTIRSRFSLDPNVPDRIPDLPNGGSIVLTIDRKVQKICEDIVKKAVLNNKAVSGTVLVMDPNTAEVLAMATYPSIDLNEYWQSAEVFTTNNRFNPGVMQLYEPGSVYKVITMAAAVDSGVVTESSTFYDTGKAVVEGVPFYNWDQKAYGVQTMVGCMQHSLNTCMIYLADLVGPERFYNYLRAFGLDDPTGIELALEDYSPINPIYGDEDWSRVNFATHSFGQGLNVTPIQLTTAAAAIANGGNLMEPHIVREIHYDDHVEKIEPKVVGHPITEETAKAVTEILAKSITEEASEAFVDGIRVAGKTGTGEIPIPGEGYSTDRTNASFIGWGPADDPKFIIYVWIQEPAYSIWGSEVSAPVFAEVVNKIAPYLRLPDDTQRKCVYDGICEKETIEDNYYGYGYY